MKKLTKIIKSPRKLVFHLAARFPKLTTQMDDEKLLRILYWSCFGKRLPLEDPLTLSEKIQWLKLYDRNPLYTVLADKEESKRFVAEQIGDNFTVKTLGIWSRIEDIDFDSLPDQFVIKTTHDSGGVVICTNKAELDKQVTINKLSASLNRNYFSLFREWPYKNIVPRIIAEEYLSPEPGETLTDFKFYCFNGEPKLLKTAVRDANGQIRTDFFDLNMKLIPLKQQGYENSTELPVVPRNLNAMVDTARKLTLGIPFVRLDFYEIDNRVLIGEFTFHPSSGLMPYEPEDADLWLGSLLQLPERKVIGE